MKPLNTISFLLALLIGTVAAYGQNADRQIKIKIKEDNNGNIFSIDTSFQLEDGQDIESILRTLGLEDELGIEGLDEEVEILIRKKKSGTDEKEQVIIRLQEEIEGMRFDSEDLLEELYENHRELEHELSIFEDALEDQNKAFLGIYYETLDQDLVDTVTVYNPDTYEETVTITSIGRHGAVLVSSVIDGTGAAAAGIRAKDMITAIDGKVFSEEMGIHDVLGGYKAGDVVEVSVIRAGKNQTFSVTLGKPNHGNNKYFMDEDGSFEFHFNDEDEQMENLRFEWADEGASTTQTPFLGVYLGSSGNGGVTISGTVDGSTAREMNLEDGDIITAINGIPTPDNKALTAAISSLSIGESVSVNYIRNGAKEVAIAPIQTRNNGCGNVEISKSLNHCFGKVEDLIQEEIILNGEDLSEELLRDLEELRNLDDLQIFFGEDFNFGDGVDIDVDTDGLRIISEDFNWNDDNDSRVIKRIAIFITMDNVSEDEAEQINAVTDNKISPNNDLPIEAVYFAPNPSDGQFNLNFELVESGRTTLRILDLVGKEVYRDEINGEPGSYSQTIDISDEPKGTYFMQIVQNDKQFSKKIVIQ